MAGSRHGVGSEPTLAGGGGGLAWDAVAQLQHACPSRFLVLGLADAAHDVQVHTLHAATTMLASRPAPEPEPIHAVPARCSEGSMQLPPGTELAQRLFWGRQSGLAHVFNAETTARCCPAQGRCLIRTSPATHNEHVSSTTSHSVHALAPAAQVQGKTGASWTCMRQSPAPCKAPVTVQRRHPHALRPPGPQLRLMTTVVLHTLRATQQRRQQTLCPRVGGTSELLAPSSHARTSWSLRRMGISWRGPPRLPTRKL
jgi:hypothetical protein